MLELFRGLPPEAYTGGGLAVLVLYAVWRQFRQDRSADRRDGAENRFVANLMEQNARLLERCDRFASERNDALQRLAVAEHEVQRLREENAVLRTEAGKS